MVFNKAQNVELIKHVEGVEYTASHSTITERKRAKFPESNTDVSAYSPSVKYYLSIFNMAGGRNEFLYLFNLQISILTDGNASNSELRTCVASFSIF